MKSTPIKSEEGLDVLTGIFKAPKISDSKIPTPYLVTATAVLSAPIGQENNAYAQLFLMKNGKLGWSNQAMLMNKTVTMNYLLVESNKVSEMRMVVNMTMGETLELFVGHVPDMFCFLEQIRFCIFST